MRSSHGDRIRCSLKGIVSLRRTAAAHWCFWIFHPSHPAVLFCCAVNNASRVFSMVASVSSRRETTAKKQPNLKLILIYDDGTHFTPSRSGFSIGSFYIQLVQALCFHELEPNYCLTRSFCRTLRCATKHLVGNHITAGNVLPNILHVWFKWKCKKCIQRTRNAHILANVHLGVRVKSGLKRLYSFIKFPTTNKHCWSKWPK